MDPTPSKMSDNHLTLLVDRLVNERTYSELSGRFNQLCVVHHPIYPAFISAHFISRENFNDCILLYLRKMPSVLPILHVPTMDFNKSHWTMSLAVSTLGCRFLGTEQSETLFRSMLEFLKRAIMYCSENTDSPCTSLEDALARLLLSIGLAYTGGDEEIGEAISILRNMTIFTSDDWLDMEVENRKPPLDDVKAVGEAWYWWRDIETARRTGYSIWLLDCMFAYHHQTRPYLTLKYGSVPLPCAEVLWEAPTATQWRHILEFATPSPSLIPALHMIYDEKRIMPTLGELSRIIVVHGLLHRFWQVKTHLEQPLSYWSPSAQDQPEAQVVPKTVWLPEIAQFVKWRDLTCDSMDILQWSALSFIGAARGIEHPTIAHLHLARIVTLIPIDQIRDLANNLIRADADLAKITELRQAVRKWSRDDQQKARLAMIHAGAVFWHIRRFSANAFYESHTVFLAALALWAYGSFSMDYESLQRLPVATGQQYAQKLHPRTESSIYEDGNDASVPTTVNLDRPVDEELAHMFVLRGGTMLALMGGVGDVRGPEGPSRVLDEAMKLLGTLSYWGCKRRAMDDLSRLRSMNQLEVPG